MEKIQKAKSGEFGKDALKLANYILAEKLIGREVRAM